MNFMNLTIALCFSGLLLSPHSFALEPIEKSEVVEFKGNWTESFPTITPLGNITHTPTAIKFGFLTVGKELHSSKGSSINGFVFPNTLELYTNSTREEFIAALKRAGIYKE
ncbi:hypothetical protein [Candidatus Odyssella thessalonicensis]|uniref:hypothetical protein n=1 Tax=Candidatus Odyssella thessalonicensis TaxID=84647 RepID=UPI000225BC8D|nr:hypothetical protein [Candidatus Odyssella thessalonicensis]